MDAILAIIAAGDKHNFFVNIEAVEIEINKLIV
jgi:hypothetical protein